MLTRSYLGAGFLRGLNSVAEVFAPYAGGSDGVGVIAGAGDAVFRRWSDALPSSEELEKIDRVIPGGADRLLSMAERKMADDFSIAQKELAYRFGETKRGQYLGWTLATGAVVAAIVMGLSHAPWQLSVTLVGIPMMGAVQTLIQGRREKAEDKQSAGTDLESKLD